MGKGAFLGKEAVLADSGWVGEVVAGAGGDRRPSTSGVARIDGVQTRQGGVTVGAGCGRAAHQDRWSG
jgi:hypothetical protein